MADVSKAVVRMYRMGTGDCFVIKFLKSGHPSYTMMIDCGTWQGSKAHLTPYIHDIKEYIGNHLDLLVVTHEHKDHVHLFDICKDEWDGITIDRIWMGWTEQESSSTVKQWQKEHGQKKKALAIAASQLEAAVNAPGYQTRINNMVNGVDVQQAQASFNSVVAGFNELQNNVAGGAYTGPLAGMKYVKETRGKDVGGKDRIKYFKPGNVIDSIEGLEGITFYVLGPPLSWDAIKVETGGDGESYAHNSDVVDNDAFAAAVLATADPTLAGAARPFEKSCIGNIGDSPYWSRYNDPDEDWRKIDDDWLNSAGALALRVNSITNNLSLALAIEFNKTGRVMLFPGDAEYGSWKSWHDIDWGLPSRNGKPHFTQDLLSRTVFYKVAHHSSHHGTAERLGMEMMDHPDLAAMITLDYNVISPSWTHTMPNKPLLKALLQQTKGRLMVMNPDGLKYDPAETVPLEPKIEAERKKMTVADHKKFTDNFKDEPMYFEFTVLG